jgi:hypothetical protein
MLSILGSVKVLVGKDDQQNYRGAGVKRTMVTAISWIPMLQSCHSLLTSLIKRWSQPHGLWRYTQAYIKRSQLSRLENIITLALLVPSFNSIECVSSVGRSLLPMIIWPASTHRSNWTTYPTSGWHYAFSESGYTDSKISLEWLKRIFDPQTKELAQDKPRVLISDGFSTHETLEILEYCFENNIILCRIPSHTSHKLQPCDVGVFGPLKAAYRDKVEELYRGGANTVNKEHFTSLYSPARDQALTSRNIKAGWMKAGLFPFNPDRVLKDIQRPPAKLTVPKANDFGAGSSS